MTAKSLLEKYGTLLMLKSSFPLYIILNGEPYISLTVILSLPVNILNDPMSILSLSSLSGQIFNNLLFSCPKKYLSCESCLTVKVEQF